MKENAPRIGLILGTVFIIMGFASSNSGIWMLGFIFLALGVFELKRRS